MSVIITSDFQADWSNLDLCEQAWDEVLDLCEEHHADTLVFAGDGKQAYNPVDIRVVKWWQKAIIKATDRKIVVIYVRGNHDRVGQFTASESWLSILRRAGAITFDSSGVADVNDFRIFVLPFAKPKETRERSRKLLKQNPDRKKDILVFHFDIENSKYNKLGMKSDASLKCSDIHNNRYRYCIGGHIHFPQLVKENVYYVGSPYCTDWGEANQRKRYILVDESGLTSIRSKIPGWYNTSWPGFNSAKIKSFDGTRVKVEVQVKADEDYGRVLDRARKTAELRYRGATVFVIPKFRDTERQDVRISISDSDERKIREYVRRTCRKELRSKCTNYMVRKLEECSSGIRRESRIKFLGIKARNFLSFKELELDYRNKGITIIQGINLDRQNKSNGSGKTSLSQVIPVSLFGRTFKDQTHDRWANRWTEDKAYAKVMMKDVKGRKIQVIRGRRPAKLQMLIDGKDKSSGMKSTDRNGTQLQIEKVTGFTWQTLANAVYIDRSIANAFLAGTRKQRTDVLSRFQNLERFEKALELVKKDRKRLQKRLHKKTHLYEIVCSTIDTNKESLKELKQVANTQLNMAEKEWKKAESRYRKWKRNSKKFLRRLHKEEKRIEYKLEFIVKALNKAREKSSQATHDLSRIRSEYAEWSQLKGQSGCPTCHQPVLKEWIVKHESEIKTVLIALKEKVEGLRIDYSKWNIKNQVLEGRYDEIEAKLSRYEREGKFFKLSVTTTEKQYRQISIDQHSAESIIAKSTDKIKELKRERDLIRRNFNSYRQKEKMFDYVIESFSRDGIPAFLNMQLVPVLNKASDYYAELFSDKDIQVRFNVEEGEFVPQVINAKGGEGIDDQSEGERALAGLIASFALREVAPRCNILVLDEPGAGLDDQTARQFAGSLSILKKRFDSIYIATHNQAILSGLSNERVLTVQKKNKISRII